MHGTTCLLSFLTNLISLPAPQVAKASKSCYVTGAFYIAWTVFAGVCVCYQRSKAAQKLN